VLRVVLARAVRSARRTTHFDLDFPGAPEREPYWCHKHRRTCRPVETASQLLRRYTLDTLERLKGVRPGARAWAERDRRPRDARDVSYASRFDGIVTSPPYPGLIDYHEQHRYAYELLGLDDRRELELGAGSVGTSRAAVRAYCEGIAAVFANAAGSLRRGAPVLVVVNDRRELYPEILAAAGLGLEERLRRHVNRRTGRRAGEFTRMCSSRELGSNPRLHGAAPFEVAVLNGGPGVLGGMSRSRGGSALGATSWNRCRRRRR
jgi:hypothetical protein